MLIVHEAAVHATVTTLR